jgi:uncharacterized repeat protein (TIGR01451 family)
VWTYSEETALKTKKHTSSRRAKYFVGLLLAVAGLSYGLAGPLRYFPGLAALANGGSKAAHTKTVKAPAFLFAPATPNVSAVKSHSPAGPFHLGDTITYSTTISNTGGAAGTGVTFTDTPDANTTFVGGTVQASPIAFDQSYNTIGNVNISVATPGVLSGDYLGLNPTATITANTNPGHGTLTLNADGSFTYDPTAGFTGTDTFTYTLSNSVGSSVGTVTITVANRIWFINDTVGACTTSCDGRLSHPFPTILSFTTANPDAAGDAIFIYTGTSSYAGPLTLKNTEKLIGQGASQSILTITADSAPSGTNQLPATGGSNPTMTAAAGNLTTGTGDEIWGVTLGNSTGTSLTASGFGNLKVRDTTINNGTGQALNLSNGTLDAIFQSVSSTNSTSAGITVNSAAGSMLVTGTTTVSTSTSSGISLGSNGATFSFAGTTSVTNSGSSGVSLTSNAGTITFAALNITNTTSNQAGLVATENTNTITTTSGAINTGSGTAVNISKASGTTPLVLSLTSVSSSGGTNDGISLVNTSGSFSVNGDGANLSVGGNSTGGTIANKSGADGSVTSGIGVYLNNASNVTLRRMTINGTNQNYGIRGFNVNTFTLEYATVAGTNGTVVSPGAPNTAGEGSICFGNDNTTGLTGTGTITNAVISGGRANNLLVQNSSGTLNRLTVTGTTFGLNQTSLDASNNPANQSMLVEAKTGSNPVMNVTVTGSTFAGSPSDQANFTGQTNTTMDVIFGGVTATPGTAPGNALSNSHPHNNFGGSNLTFASQGSMTFHLLGNTMRDANGSAVTLFKASAGTSLTGFLDNNIIGVAAVTNSGSQTGNGIFVSAAGTGTMSYTITNNQIHQINGNSHIFADNTGGSYTANFDIEHNTFDTPGAGWFAGIAITNGANTSSDTVNACAVIGGSTAAQKNTLNFAGGLGVIVGSSGQNGGHTFNLPTYAGGASFTNVQNFIQANNAGSFTTQAYADAPATAAAFTGTGTTCGTPTSAPTTLAPSSASSEMAASAISPIDGQPNSDHAIDQVLRAARGEGPSGADIQKLTQDELSWMMPAAIQRWQEAGIAAEDLARLQTATFEIADLPNSELASRAGTKIKIAETAAGYGWYVAPYPGQDSEFDVPVPNKEMQATEYSRAFGRVDLLTVVMRQLGTVYLQGKTSIPKTLEPLMEGTLSPGVRRLPDASSIELKVPTEKLGPPSQRPPTAKEAVPNQKPTTQSRVKVADAPVELAMLNVQESSPRAQYAIYSRNGRQPALTPAAFHPAKPRRTNAVVAMAPPMFFVPPVNVSIGTLPAGKSVIVKFQVTVNNPLTSPSTASSVSNTGSVSGGNFTTLNSNTDTAQLCVPPVVSAPLTNQTVAQGTTATFTTTLSGSTPFTSVWKKNGSVLTSGVSLGGRATITNTTVGSSTTSTLTITGTIPSDADTYTVDSTDVAACGDTVPTQSATLTVVQPPTLSKAFGVSTIPLNGTTSLTLTLHNPNASVNLTSIGFSDNLPAGLQVANPTGIAATCTGTWNASPGDTTLNFGGGTLNASQSCTVSVNITGTSAGAKNNTANAPASNEGGTGVGSNTATLTVIAPPTVSKSFNPTSIPLNTNSTLSFTITNPNTASALSAVAFTDNLPAGVVVATPNGLAGSCGSGTVTATAGSSTITLSSGTLTASPAAGSSCTFSVNVTGTSAGSKSNTTGAITSTEGGTGTTSNTAVLTVVAPPTISKAFGAANIPLNGTTTVTFTITNPAANSTAENGIAFSDTLTGGLQVASTPGVANSCGGTVTAVAASTGISLSSGTIATPGATCTIVVNVTGTLSGTVSNTTGTISSTNGGTGATSNTATLTVATPPSISKVFGAATIPLNGSTSLTFTITNPNSNVALTGIAFTDNLPPGLVVATPNGLVNTGCSGTVTATAGSGAVSLSAGTLASSGSCTITVNVTGTAAGVKNNVSGAVTSTEGGPGNTASANITVVAPPTVSKAFGAATIPLNGTTSLTLTVGNPNATVALTGIAFSDTLPAGLVVATPNGQGGTCTGTITDVAGSSSVSLAGGSLGTSANCTITLNVTGTTAGVKNNTTGAPSSNEGGTGVVSNTATVTVVAPVTITKAFGAANIPLNGSTSLTLTLTNPSATVTQNAIAVSDTLPAGLVVATPNGLGGTCTGTITAVAGSSSVSLAGGTLAPGANCTMIVNVTGTTSGAKNNTTGAPSSTEGGTGVASNTATVTVASPPTISKSFNPTSIPVNTNSTLTFTITNPNSNVALTGIAFTDNLPGGLTVATPNGLVNTGCGGTPTATAGSSSVSLSAGTLATSGSCTIAVNVTGTTAGVKNNVSGAVTSTEGGPGNTASANLTVVSPPGFSKAFGATSIPLNGSTTLVFTIQNTNPTTTETGITFTDTLPAGLVVGTNGPITCTGAGALGGTVTATTGTNTISLSGLGLLGLAQCTITVNVNGTAAGTKLNVSGAISSTEGGTGTTASASMDVVAPPTISKAFGAANISLNASTSLTFTITNPAANGVGETGVSFTDPLPAGLVVATPNGLVNTCGGTPTAVAGSGSVTLTSGTIAVNSICTLTINVTGTTSGVKSNTTGPVSSTNGGTGTPSNTATVTVAAAPTITKAFGAASIPANGSTSLTFTITNPNATVALSGIAFTDTLPAGLVVATPNGLVNTGCGGTATAVAGSGSVSLSAGTLAASGSCTITVNVTGTTAGVKNNSVQVTSTEGGTGNTSNASITVVAAPVIIKAFGAASIPLSGTTTLQFTIQNNNTTTTLTGVGFGDTLSGGLVVSTPNGLTGNTCGATPTAVAGSNSVSLAGGSIAASSTCTFTINVTGTAAGTQNNTTGNVTSTEGGTGGTASASVDVVAPPSISKAFGAANIPLNGTTSLTFTITNPAANAVAETGVAFTDTLPAGLVVATPNGLTNTCGGTATATAGSGSITLTGGSIAVNSSCTVMANVTGVTAGNYTNSTTVSSTNGGTGNTTTANLAVGIPPTITKAFGAATIPLNTTTSLTFTIANPNTSLTLTGITFSDALPAGLVVATPNGLSNTCGGTATATAGSSSVSLTGSSVAANANCTVSLNVLGTTAGLLSNTTGVISANESGPGTTSNTATITVIAPPSIGKLFGGATVQLNATTSLTFTITNPNSAAAGGLTGVAVTDTLPAGLVVATPNGLTGSCGAGTITAVAGSNSISLTGGTIPTSSNCTFAVNVKGIAGGAQVNTTGAVTSTNGGTGNTATASITVLLPDLTITKTHVGNFSQGQTVGSTYTITVSNSGTAPTAGTVTAVDTLPPSMLATAISGAGWTCPTLTSCNRSDILGVGASYPAISLTVAVALNAPASVTNSVTVSGGGETNTANDTATDVTSITAVPQPLTINLTVTGGGNVTVNPGDPATFVFTVNSASALLGGINFTCSSLPAGSTCTFTNQGETQGTAQTTLTVTTTAPTASNKPLNIRGTAPLYAALLVPFFGLVQLARRGKKGKSIRLRLAMWLGGLIVLAALVGCGGGSSSLLGGNGHGGTPPGFYPITVTATSSTNPSITATTNVSVTVR